jgi:hypothetical protein
MIGYSEKGRERPSFLKKRSKKLLFSGACLEAVTRAKMQKFFGSFFQKRTFFLAASR